MSSTEATTTTTTTSTTTTITSNVENGTEQEEKKIFDGLSQVLGTAGVNVTYWDNERKKLPKFTNLNNLKVSSVNVVKNVATVALDDDKKSIVKLIGLTPYLWKIFAYQSEGSPEIQEPVSYAVGTESDISSEGSEISLIRDDSNATVCLFLNKSDDNKDNGEFPAIKIVIRMDSFTLNILNDNDFCYQQNFCIGFREGMKNHSCIQFVQPENTYIYGLGEKSGQLKRDNKRWMMWNTDSFQYDDKTDPLYQSLPYSVHIHPESQNYFGFFVDNTGFQEWNFTNEEEKGFINVELYNSPLRCYIFAGNNTLQLYRTYTNLTGTTPLPAQWALGYHQCRWSYYPESKVREIAEGFRKRDIPIDAIYLDIDYMDQYKCFTFDHQRFPDPKAFISDYLWNTLKMKTVCIIDPGIKIEKGYDVYESGLKGEHFVKTKDGKEFYTATVWPGECHFPDFFKESTRKWWGEQFTNIISNVGIAGVWNDMNEPACFDTPLKTFDINKVDPFFTEHHNAYGMHMARGTYEALQNLHPNSRPFVITRSAYAGIQKYSTSWTGDNSSTWSHLKQSIPMLLNMALMGQVITGADVGGFSSDCYAELYSRWIQMASLFYPLCRTHSEDKTKDQEPWSFGVETEQISKKYITLRYRLLPYLYTWMYKATEASKEDLQLYLRPMFVQYPNDLKCYEDEWENTQLFVGPNLLVCPVLESGAKSRKVYLPKGDKWIDFHSGTLHHGGQVIDVKAPLDVIPLFVRDGTILPMRKKARENVYETMKEDIEFKHFGTPSNNDENNILYLDDGISQNYRNKGEFGLYQINPPEELKLLKGKGFPLAL